ncbi:adenylate/guanylate cyclase domain-containing protein [Mangrovimonas sp. TPBH4]|uniref:adenylate/guanylate cyclase domain-containing protein n=1 Tax=Mangrovimonas sp. TPBH4 TaxID=1645914 RepID=UPI001E3051C2|nr:adenylate/guanylate cyclase domain-containing protein [Mangrovimonas sp. TPBH4]
MQLYRLKSDPKNELQLIKDIAENQVQPSSKLEYAELLLAKARLLDSLNYVHSGYLQKGNALRDLGKNVEALEAYFLSLNLAKELKDVKGEGGVLISIADVYSIMENSDNALKYYDEGIAVLKRTKDTIKLATALLNAGDEFFNIKDYDKALQYFENSRDIFQKVDHPIGMAYNYGNLGMVYASLGRHEEAKAHINQAILILKDLEDYYPISVYLTYMSQIYETHGDMDTAQQFAQQSLDLAKEYGLKEQMSDAYLLISQLKEHQGDIDSAYTFYKSHVAYRDSLNNIQKVQDMADLRTDFEVAQKQLEVDLLNQQKRTQKIIVIATTIALFLIGLLAVGLFRRNAFIQKTKRIIEKEKQRSDQLLLNILPEETAKELKEHGKVTSHRFDSVSVLFTDFVGFTKYSENLTPEALVEAVDFYFSKFDEIIERYGLEKIKTIGDAYMCVGGLPFEIEDHAKKIVKAAIEIVTFVEEISKNQHTEKNFIIRVGIHTGSVVAGVVGRKKFAYDVWGDTVNIASRMESNSEEGRINISAITHQLIQDEFECEYRGEIDVKNKGMMKMYFVTHPNDDAKQPIKSIAYGNSGS